MRTYVEEKPYGNPIGLGSSLASKSTSGLSGEHVSRLVDCYWHFNPGTTELNQHLVIPDNRIDFIHDDRGWHLCGPMTRPFYGSDREIFGLRINPSYFYSILQIPLSEFKDLNVELSSIDSLTFSDIFHRREYSSFKTFVDTMSTQLAQKEIKRYRLIEAALEQLHCGISVRKVSFHLGLSDQHLRRLFKKHLGISPKKYQKVEQFIKVKKLIESKKMNVSSALADSNYFDQSHFIHTCRELTNLSPCQYFS